MPSMPKGMESVFHYLNCLNGGDRYICLAYLLHVHGMTYTSIYDLIACMSGVSEATYLQLVLLVDGVISLVSTHLQAASSLPEIPTLCLLPLPCA